MKASSNEPGSRGFGFLSLKKYLVSHMEAHTCNSIIWEAKTGILLGVQVQPGLKSEGDPVLKHQSICFVLFCFCVCVCFVLIMKTSCLFVNSDPLSCFPFLFWFGILSQGLAIQPRLVQIHDAPASAFGVSGYEMCTTTPRSVGASCLILNAHKKHICRGN